ncbi:MAG: hypothetical protein CSA62_14335 [Planctomycetota bacterium]|nr:MAG: hypothetical protein CSA62_14335 [Planctomycetota bacterium]
MTPSRRRRRTSRKQPAVDLEAIEELEAVEELEALEEIEELPELGADEDLEELPDLGGLEELEEDDSGIEIGIGELASDEERDKYDICIEAAVPNMERAEIPAAVHRSLTRALISHAEDVRLRRVLLRFGGEAMIPSKAKEPIGEAFAPLRPLLLAVQRGYDDETVIENEMPSAELSVSEEGDTRRVIVRGGDLNPAELRIVLAQEIAKIGDEASGKSFELGYEGSYRLSDDLIQSIQETLQGAGAIRLSAAADPGADPKLLFDRELDEVLQLREASDEDFDLLISLGKPKDTAQLEAAWDWSAAAKAEQLTGRKLRLRAVEDDDAQALVKKIAALKPARLEVEGAEGNPVLVLPRLLRSVSKEDRTKIGIVPSGRDEAASIEAFQREIPLLSKVVHEHRVVVEWPEGTELNEALEKSCVEQAMLPLGPKSVAFRSGETIIPVYPTPVQIDAQGDDCLVEIDTEAGPPKAIATALALRLESHASQLQGKCLRCEAKGNGPFSRTMKRTLIAGAQQHGATRLELRAEGFTDVLLPPLLHSNHVDEGTIRVSLDPAGRNEAQIEAGLDRELGELVLPLDGTVHITGVDPSPELLKYAIDNGAARVLLGDEQSTQVYPPLFDELSEENDDLVLRAHPTTDDEMLLRQIDRELPERLASLTAPEEKRLLLLWPGASKPFEGPLAHAIDALKAKGPAVLRVAADEEARPAQVHPKIVRRPIEILGRRDTAEVPMRLIGIEWTDEPEEIEISVQQISAMREDLEAARVLVTFLDHDGNDAPPLPDDEPLTAAVRAALQGVAGATLLHREDSGQSMFETVDSKIEGLEVGQRFRDPRKPKSQ